MSARTMTQIPGFRGDVIVPDRDDYDDARAVWNGTVHRRPRLIARCRGTADVAAAVRFARDREPRDRRSRWGSQRRRHRGVRRRDRGRPVGDARRLGRSGQAHGPRPGRRPVGRCRPRDAGARSRYHGRHRQPYRRRRRQPGRRHRLAHAQARAHRRQPHGGRGGHRRGRGHLRVRPTITPTCSGPCAAAAGTSASPACSGSRCTPWAPPSSPDRCSGRPRTPPTSCASTATSSPTLLTSSAPSSELGTIPPLPVVDDCLHFRPAIAVASCYAGPIEDGERAVRALRQFGAPLVDLVGPGPVRRPSTQHRRHRPPRLALLLEGREPHPPVRRGHRHRRRARLRRHLPEVVRGDLPHGVRRRPRPARRLPPTPVATSATT